MEDYKNFLDEILISKEELQERIAELGEEIPPRLRVGSCARTRRPICYRGSDLGSARLPTTV